MGNIATTMILNVMLSYNINVKSDTVIKPDILQFVGNIRSVTEEPLLITSNYRSYRKNLLVEGSKHSKHLCGQAIDIRAKSLTAATKHDIMKLKDRYIIIDEGDHIHIETQEPCKVVNRKGE